MMKFFYTRKDIDEEIAKALAEADRRREDFERFDSLQRDVWQLRDELHDLRIRLDPTYMKAPTGSVPVNVEAVSKVAP
jgi:hypothetical protein